MDIKVREMDSGIRILDIDGRLDLHTIHTFKDVVEPLQGTGDLILNFSQVPAVDSSALGVLIRLGMDLEESDHRLIIFGLTHLVLHVFELCGLNNRFPIYKTEEQAFSFVSRRQSPR